MHPTHRIFEVIPPAVEPEGPRPKLRWKDGVSEDARKIGAAGPCQRPERMADEAGESRSTTDDDDDSAFTQLINN